MASIGIAFIDCSNRNDALPSIRASSLAIGFFFLIVPAGLMAYIAFCQFRSSSEIECGVPKKIKPASARNNDLN